MTQGVVDGHYMRWFLNGTAIAQATSCSISFSKETRESSSKDTTGKWSVKKGGKRSFSGSCEALYAEGETLETLWASFNSSTAAGEILDAEFSTDETGDKFWDVQIIITSIEQNADDNEDVTYSVSFEGTGEPTRGTVA